MGERCAAGMGCFGGPTLDYVSASHGGWGIVRIAALVPESHQLFVCPSACGRHGALGGAVNGIRDRISYLFITEGDIVSGDFEQMIVEAAEQLFEALEKRPKVLFIFTSCLDDLLGTDHEPILEELSRRYPEVSFRHCTMNPISLDSPYPPGITVNMNMFSLLKPRQERRRTVNVVGSNVTFDPGCDLKQILGAKGYRVNHISDCHTFEEFQEMAGAALNIVTSPIALKAAQEMEKRLGIPWIQGFVNYSPEDITDFYRELGERLGEELLPLTDPFRERAEEKIRQAREIIGEYPIAVDYQAVLKPFSLALMLVGRGFRVEMIASDSAAPHEQESLRRLAKEAPDLLVENPMNHDAVKFPHQGERYLCIGFDCGYMTGSDKVLNLMEDEGLYGFDGICRLMDGMVEAYAGSADVHRMIKEAGLIL